MRQLHRAIRQSDWLKENTAEKWMEENPDTAKEILDIISKERAKQLQVNNEEKDSDLLKEEAELHKGSGDKSEQQLVDNP
ncbi:hypothetical protein C0Q70_03661 [Pomacea canaliculata]|uniref:Uncharacterized protein n=1 Tax=Pomacea canaliculata TaxID=400727 RepID=A0A2T7PTC6_POMCA|nr:hypothetical protein C0Q70_03661 [Pomacea canaliculata]